MNHGRRSAEGASPTQRALVLSFLGQFDEAIRRAGRGGSVQARQGHPVPAWQDSDEGQARFADAAGSFQECLEILVRWLLVRPWGATKSWCGPKRPPRCTTSSATVTRRCRTTEKGWSPTLPLWPIDSGFADGFYHRGLCRILMKQAKALLAINPAMYQSLPVPAPLTTPARRRYSKAVLNCNNEALRLQPQCVRALLYRGSIKLRIRAYGLAVDDLTRAIAVDADLRAGLFQPGRLSRREAPAADLALRDYGVVLMLNDRRLRYRTLERARRLPAGCLLATGQTMSDFCTPSAPATPAAPPAARAVRAFSPASDANSNFYDAYIGRANCYLDFGSPRSVLFARRDYERVLMQRPAPPAARVNLAFSLQMDARHARRLGPADRTRRSRGNCRALWSRSRCPTLDGAWRDANEAACDCALAVPESLVTRGVVQQCARDAFRAMRDYQKAILAEPSFSLAYYNAANDVPAAAPATIRRCRYYDSCIRLNPPHEAPARDVDGALADASRAIELSPPHARTPSFKQEAKLACELCRNFDSAEADLALRC
uniref:TPR_REGION domain-containing protein n=1 Tax=Macrostomum lignano TaxID=282301 RepID=A0A1I8FRE3_9PLAT